MQVASGKRPAGAGGPSQVRLASALAAAALLLQGCADYFVLEGHLKDNPMDEAIASGIEPYHMKYTRADLLKRFPLRRPISEAKRYLESVGATCRPPKPRDAAIVCEYRQNRDKVLRTPIGDFLSSRSVYDFRILLASSGQRLEGIEVCQSITRIHYKEPSDKPVSRRTYPYTCTTDPEPYAKVR